MSWFWIGIFTICPYIFAPLIIPCCFSNDKQFCCLAATPFGLVCIVTIPNSIDLFKMNVRISHLICSYADDILFKIDIQTTLHLNKHIIRSAQHDMYKAHAYCAQCTASGTRKTQQQQQRCNAKMVYAKNQCSKYMRLLSSSFSFLNFQCWIKTGNVFQSSCYKQNRSRHVPYTYRFPTK